jgi:hypothetical protein
MAHKSQEVLSHQIAKAHKLIKLGGQYAHYKDPKHRYMVTGFVVIEETGELGVVYLAEYGEKLSFVRPVNVWLEKVEWKGNTVPRFTPVV